MREVGGLAWPRHDATAIVDAKKPPRNEPAAALIKPTRDRGEIKDLDEGSRPFRPSALGKPGDDLLSRVLRRSTIGAGAFHGRVRDGIGCGRSAKITRPAKGGDGI
jgi:hypothetical protein